MLAAICRQAKCHAHSDALPKISERLIQMASMRELPNKKRSGLAAVTSATFRCRQSRDRFRNEVAVA